MHPVGILYFTLQFISHREVECCGVFFACCPQVLFGCFWTLYSLHMMKGSLHQWKKLFFFSFPSCKSFRIIQGTPWLKNVTLMRTCVGRHASVFFFFVKYCHVKTGAFYLSSPVAPWIILRGTLQWNKKKREKRGKKSPSSYTMNTLVSQCLWAQQESWLCF